MPGRLLAGEYPGAPREPVAVEKLGAFLDSGIDSFLDLTGPNELEPYAHLFDALGHIRNRPVEHRRLSIPDMSVPEPEHIKRVPRKCYA